MSNPSLLRYPGGKTRAIKIITQYFPPNLTELCSPFFGGGSIELYVAQKGVKVFGYDIFNPLVEFWQYALNQPRQLAKKVQEYYPLSKNHFYDLQKKQATYKTKMERAAVFYVLNRSSFSGSTMSGGMSPGHPRFTKTSINRLYNFGNPNVTIEKLHFRESINAHKSSFLYLDPPYLNERALYGKNGNAHREFNHEELYEILDKRKNWVLSYNDCEQIRKMYQGYVILQPKWKYGMSSDKKSNEILIFG